MAADDAVKSDDSVLLLHLQLYWSLFFFFLRLLNKVLRQRFFHFFFNQGDRF